MAAWFNDAGYLTVNSMPATTMSWPQGDFYRFQRKYLLPGLRLQGAQPEVGAHDRPVRDRRGSSAGGCRGETAAVRAVRDDLGALPFQPDPEAVRGLVTAGRRQPVRPGGRGTPAADAGGGCHRRGAGLRGGHGVPAGGGRRLRGAFPGRPPRADRGGGRSPALQRHHRAGARLHSVPIHVWSREPELLEPFLRRGYTPGLVPRQRPPHAGLESFWPGFLEDFSPPGATGG